MPESHFHLPDAQGEHIFSLPAARLGLRIEFCTTVPIYPGLAVSCPVGSSTFSLFPVHQVQAKDSETVELPEGLSPDSPVMCGGEPPR